MHSSFKKYLLKATNSSACAEVEVIQSLWSGYGKIIRYQLVDSLLQTVVVKNISLNQSSAHPRGWDSDNSHSRKVKSYQVETYWYEKWAHFCSSECVVPKFIGSYAEDRDQWIILEDLNKNYPLRKDQVDLLELKVCLKWLANFHISFLTIRPTGLWQIGTYWHLETRPDEFKKIENQELKSKAHLIDKLLNQSRYQTIVHGDAKLANFCFSQDGRQVAAVDFQYVGGGCGMKDVAYFIGSCLSSTESEIYQNELLDYYFAELHIAFDRVENGVKKFAFDFKALEQEWRKMYPLACTDFTRFLLGWMPSHQKVNSYSLKMMNEVLADL